MKKSKLEILILLVFAILIVATWVFVDAPYGGILAGPFFVFVCSKIAQ